jgi:DNA-binding MarR family transcriptional regulator
LEAEQLVQRVDDPADRRSVQAAITMKGRAKYDAGAAEIARLHEEFASQVGVEDRAALKRLLTALG